jgi:hypothetical protein
VRIIQVGAQKRRVIKEPLFSEIRGHAQNVGKNMNSKSHSDMF